MIYLLSWKEPYYYIGIRPSDFYLSRNSTSFPTFDDRDSRGLSSKDVREGLLREFGSKQLETSRNDEDWEDSLASIDQLLYALLCQGVLTRTDQLEPLVSCRNISLAATESQMTFFRKAVSQLVEVKRKPLPPDEDDLATDFDSQTLFPRRAMSLSPPLFPRRALNRDDSSPYPLDLFEMLPRPDQISQGSADGDTLRVDSLPMEVLNRWGGFLDIS